MNASLRRLSTVMFSPSQNWVRVSPGDRADLRRREIVGDVLRVRRVLERPDAEARRAVGDHDVVAEVLVVDEVQRRERRALARVERRAGLPLTAIGPRAWPQVRRRCADLSTAGSAVSSASVAPSVLVPLRACERRRLARRVVGGGGRGGGGRGGGRGLRVERLLRRRLRGGGGGGGGDVRRVGSSARPWRRRQWRRPWRRRARRRASAASRAAFVDAVCAAARLGLRRQRRCARSPARAAAPRRTRCPGTRTTRRRRRRTAARALNSHVPSPP